MLCGGLEIFDVHIMLILPKAAQHFMKIIKVLGGEQGVFREISPTQYVCINI